MRILHIPNSISIDLSRVISVGARRMRDDKEGGPWFCIDVEHYEYSLTIEEKNITRARFLECWEHYLDPKEVG